MSTLRAILGVNRGSGAAVLRSDPRVMSWRETRSMGGCGEGAGVEETGWLFGPPSLHCASAQKCGVRSTYVRDLCSAGKKPGGTEGLWSVDERHVGWGFDLG